MPVFLLALGAGFSSVLGCRVEQAPNRIEREEISQAKLAEVRLPTMGTPSTDEAREVIRACGQPNADAVMPVYSKYYNGPVRRLEYVGSRTVTLDFIPSLPKAELSYDEAPLPHDGREYGALAPNATWQFQAAYMAQLQLVTARRVSEYLPCAGQALSAGF